MYMHRSFNEATLKIHFKKNVRSTSSLMLQQVPQTKCESPVAKTKRDPNILSSRCDTSFPAQHFLSFVHSVQNSAFAISLNWRKTWNGTWKSFRNFPTSLPFGSAITSLRFGGVKNIFHHKPSFWFIRGYFAPLLCLVLVGRCCWRLSPFWWWEPHGGAPRTHPRISPSSSSWPLVWLLLSSTSATSSSSHRKAQLQKIVLYTCSWGLWTWMALAAGERHHIDVKNNHRRARVCRDTTKTPRRRKCQIQFKKWARADVHVSNE